MSDGNIRVPTISDWLQTQSELSFFGTKTKVEFNGNCLKQSKVTYDHRKVVKNYIVYEINKSFSISDYPTIKNCLSGAVNVTKNADINKYKYSGYGIGFDVDFIHTLVVELEKM